MTPKPTYAAGTGVSESRSREEIEHELMRFGADEFGYHAAHGHAAVAFAVDGRRYVLRVPMPTEDVQGKDRRGYNTTVTVTQRRKERWRALALGIKAILVMVTEGMLTLDEVLLPYLLLPSGETVADRLLPEVAEIARSGQLPPMMPGVVRPAPNITALGERPGGGR